jgi:hypothetical protein
VGYKNPDDYVKYHADYRERNREKLRIGAIEYRKANPERDKVWREEYRAKPERKAREKEVKAQNYLENKAQRNAQNLENYYRRKYGLSRAEKEAMWLAQDKKCKICAKVITLKEAKIDHIHDTDPIVVRGILCGHCNRGLGHFYDKSSLLELAVTYLKTFHC